MTIAIFNNIGVQDVQSDSLIFLSGSADSEGEPGSEGWFDGQNSTYTGWTSIGSGADTTYVGSAVSQTNNGYATFSGFYAVQNWQGISVYLSLSNIGSEANFIKPLMTVSFTDSTTFAAFDTSLASRNDMWTFYNAEGGGSAQFAFSTIYNRSAFEPLPWILDPANYNPNEWPAGQVGANMSNFLTGNAANPISHTIKLSYTA